MAVGDSSITKTSGRELVCSPLLARRAGTQVAKAVTALHTLLPQQHDICTASLPSYHFQFTELTAFPQLAVSDQLQLLCLFSERASSSSSIHACLLLSSFLEYFTSKAVGEENHAKQNECAEARKREEK